MKLLIPNIKYLFFAVIFSLLWSCGDRKESKGESTDKFESKIVEEVEDKSPLLQNIPENIDAPEDMVWIPGAILYQGAVAQDPMAMGHEKPSFEVAVDGFFMDATEVTNAKFKKFVDETGYITIAEREIDWEEMKKQLPEGTPKPHDSIMQPGSLTFKKTKTSVPNLYDFSQWWQWTIGANWKHPDGPGSSIHGKENHPVVHIAYEDALAYCEWSGRRLPTEAEWELAARGGKSNTIFFWGDEKTALGKNANTWEGEFPVENTKNDGYEERAPVKSYPPNTIGLYDMAGNVWEWTSDWYNTNYYNEMSGSDGTPKNPQGANSAFNERDPYAREKVMKGGLFCVANRIAPVIAYRREWQRV
ncbi:formylglycine-generating enzyme family protein [Maribacter halichondriae]|uniref:formylglycine-generating enzyme family protein n=1 Tax=Maribacter halichondriae TaxID=2980554 RepID=UPI0030760537